MSDFDSPEYLPPSEDGQPDREFTRIQVGDLFADDAQLRGSLGDIARVAREDRPRTGSGYIVDLFDALQFGMKPVKVAWKGIKFVAKRLTNHEVRAAQADEIRSKADVNRATASSIEGDTEIKLAVAEQVRTQTQMAKYRELKELGFDWDIDESGEIPMRIGVTKRKDKDGEETDDASD